jgi:DNA-binding NarL/FixJ family response regulator
VHPIATQALGAVLLDEGRAEPALEALRGAQELWRRIPAPYHDARVRVLIAQALQLLGDRDTARVELAAARDVFGRLGAVPDLERLAQHTGPESRTAVGLTPRELEVLRLVAGGMTNKQIAERLVISEKTVARHIHNVLTKRGLANRAAATAFAYENELV